MNFWVIKLAVMTYILAILLFSLSGCKAMNNAPISHIYVIDYQHQVCSKRVITNKKTIASRHVEDLPLSDCDGVIALSPQEFINLRVYLKSK